MPENQLVVTKRSDHCKHSTFIILTYETTSGTRQVAYFHILNREDIVDSISRFMSVVFANGQFVYIIKRKLPGGFKILESTMSYLSRASALMSAVFKTFLI